MRPLERRTDTVLMVETESCADRYILAVESQTDPDDAKCQSWPQYVGFLVAKYQCNVGLLVLSTKKATAAWARRPIRIGLPGLPPCMIVQPLVLGPDNVPRITDPAQARHDVGFTVLSALVHSRSEDANGILETLADALETIDVHTATCYAEYTEAALSNTAAQQIWRALMASTTRPYISQIRAEGIAAGRVEGRAEGEAEMIFAILDTRGITITNKARTRITNCTDTDQLLAWGRRAVTIDTIDDLFT